LNAANPSNDLACCEPLAERDAQDVAKFLETLTGEYKGQSR
jgi:hypothetical protein